MSRGMPKERDVLLMIWTNFKNSLRPRPIRGNLKGEDKLGNKYFEIPANPSVGKRRNERWFQPKTKDKFDQDLPAEWESWLRGRRETPPTLEEIARNTAIMELTRKNAEEKGYITKDPGSQKIQSFPKYDEYEISPGEKQDKDK